MHDTWLNVDCEPFFIVQFEFLFFCKPKMDSSRLLIPHYNGTLKRFIGFDVPLLWKTGSVSGCVVLYCLSVAASFLAP